MEHAALQLLKSPLNTLSFLFSSAGESLSGSSNKILDDEVNNNRQLQQDVNEKQKAADIKKNHKPNKSGDNTANLNNNNLKENDVPKNRIEQNKTGKMEK